MASKQPERPKIWLLPEHDADLIEKRILSETTSTTYDYSCFILETDRNFHSPMSEEPDECEIEIGALRPGGALDLLSLEAFGLLSQYAAVGILLGVFNALQYPLFQNYLHMEGYQTASYSVLITLGWTSKIFFGILSDCLPIFGYKRRPYMVIGWAICGVCCLLMAISPFPAPYYGKPGLKGLDNLTAEQETFINHKAPTSASFFIVMSMAASLGYVMADVAADAMVVHYAQREPAAIRGRVQTAIYFTRDSFTMIPMLVVGFCMNDYKYGGQFTWSISPTLVYACLTIPCVIAAYGALIHVVEEKADHRGIGQYMQNVWNLLKQRVVWQVCAFMFFNGLFFGYDSTLFDPISSIWVQVMPLVSTSFSIVSQLFRVVAMFVIGKYALNWDWRAGIAVSSVVLVVFDTTIKGMAIWNVYRNQYFQCMLLTLEAIPNAFIFLFSSYLIVEIVQVGNEGLVYALLTTCSNMATPLSIVMAKLVDSFWNATLDDIQIDDTSVRWQVTYSYICAASFKLFSLVFLALMPRQKAYVHVLRRTGSSSTLAGTVVLVIFALGYVYNIVNNVLSIFQSTSCLRIAGGKGC
ncbi:hypothetical protein LEN26_010362 [Aphanomyces euteiches]|nr:hypothetical protein LEN26_010362 [Aphanomyces euteiches]